MPPENIRKSRDFYVFRAIDRHISKEQKSIFSLGNFNISFLNYNEHNQTNEFLDSLASNSLLPLILQQIRITSHR